MPHVRTSFRTLPRANLLVSIFNIFQLVSVLEIGLQYYPMHYASFEALSSKLDADVSVSVYLTNLKSMSQPHDDYQCR